MDYSQQKLTKKEWESIEVPLHKNETNILQLISIGYNNTDYKYNESLSLMSFMKLTQENKTIEKFHTYLYIHYFEKIITNMTRNYKLNIKIKVKQDKIGLKSADKIRINNTNNKLESYKNTIYEYILLNECERFLKKDNVLYFYNISQLLQNSISGLNTYVSQFVSNLIEMYKDKISIKDLVKNAYKYIEKNDLLTNYTDKQLYSHQKELFETCTLKQSKLILYEAPTGTGKTMSPIGLAQGNKLIFVCAAKHVGLQLARACISMHIPIGIAFGCKDPGDVRLHYYAAKEYTKNYKSGGIFHVDHSVGDKVQVIISDVVSYLPAMYYMSAFTKNLEDIIMYWDEPTIGLDYNNHELHSIVQKIWRENMVPNVVLSSATLPKEKYIQNTINSFNLKFNNALVKSIVSYDCKKSIPIISLDGYYALPHTIYSSYQDVRESIEQCKETKTVLRYMDLNSICNFVYFVNKKLCIEDKMKIKNYFESVDRVNSVNLKLYYLDLLETLETQWGRVLEYVNENKKKKHESNIYVATKDAHTLNYGPTLFLAENTDKIAKFCFQSAKIPEHEMEQILENISYNDKLKTSIYKLKKQLSNKQDTSKEDPTKTRIKKTPGDDLRRKIEKLENQFKSIELSKKYVPNTIAHMYEYCNTKIEHAFKADIDDKTVEQIIMLDGVEDLWKVLLIMGIGVFTNSHKSIDYMEIMKKLAYEQKLYMVIASTDYIYGTNYQFCHEYVSKDLENMSQEKLIQALGRVGRSNTSYEYSIRLRSDRFLNKLFKKELHKIEVENMNRLFST